MQSTDGIDHFSYGHDIKAPVIPFFAAVIYEYLVDLFWEETFCYNVIVLWEINSKYERLSIIHDDNEREYSVCTKLLTSGNECYSHFNNWFDSQLKTSTLHFQMRKEDCSDKLSISWK